MVQRFEEGPVRIPNTDNRRELEMFLQGLAQTLRHRIRFPLGYHLTSTGVAHLAPLVFPAGMIEPTLKLVNIAGWHDGAAVAGGNTTLLLRNYTSGAPTTLATFTLATALASYTVTSTDYEVNIPDGARLTLAVGTDGGHRAIYASAWFSQIPRRI